MEKIITFLKKASDNINTLQGDVSRILQNIKDKEEIDSGAKTKKDMKSLQSVTVLRKDKEEIIFTQNNKELTFIKDQLNRIFGGG